jgi:hypothetical protein
MTVELSKDRDSYRARVQLVGENGSLGGVREIMQPSASCQPIVDTVALSISIAIDPLSLTRPRATRTAPEPSPAPRASVPKPRPSIEHPTAEGHREIERPRPGAARIEIGLGAGFWVDAAPGPNVSGDAFARVRALRHFSLALEGQVDLPGSQATTEGTVRSWLALGSIVPCFHERFFSVCIAGAMGTLRATSTARISREASAFRVGWGPRLGAESALGDALAVWGHIEGLWTFPGETLEIDDSPVYPLSRFSFGVTVGASLRLF